MMTRVVTYQTSWCGDRSLDITPTQEAQMRAACVWPRGLHGDEYATVSVGLHTAWPTFTAAEISRIIAGEHAVIDVLWSRADAEA